MLCRNKDNFMYEGLNKPTLAKTDDIGTGRRTALYGFLLLRVVIFFIVSALTGIYNPFQGTEVVGP